MKKLVLINSFGPMGSTLLSGLVEKLGFTNLPVRKLRLHQYLMGLEPVGSPLMPSRLKNCLISHAKPDLRGGVSVMDRDSQKPCALVDFEKVREKVDNIRAENIQDLYFKCRNIYADAVIYKNIASNPDWQIELTTDIHRFDYKKLAQAYQDNFDDVRMIHIRRPFRGWINSVASQAFVNQHWIKRIKLFPHMRYADYVLYEQAAAALPGLHIEFDDMFSTPIEELAGEIADFLDVPPPDVNLRQETYDLYGKITPYDKAFTKFDDKIEFLRPSTLDYFEKLIETKRIQKIPYNIFAWLGYIRDMTSYRLKQHKKG